MNAQMIGYWNFPTLKWKIALNIQPTFQSVQSPQMPENYWHTLYIGGDFGNLLNSLNKKTYIVLYVWVYIIAFEYSYVSTSIYILHSTGKDELS